MFKKIFLAICCLVFILGLVACNKEEAHVCQHECPICGKCTDLTCEALECQEKCLGHDPELTLQEQIESNMLSFINNLIDTTKASGGYIPSWNKENFKGRWNYIDGVFLNALITLSKETDVLAYQKDLQDFFISYINHYINSNGEFISPNNTSKIAYNLEELDSVCESRILFDAYDLTKDSRYLKAIDYTLNAFTNPENVPLANEYNFSHKKQYINQVWLDGMYMYAPFWARYAQANKEESIFKTIRLQYEYIYTNMKDEETGLYYHGHDTTKNIFWADKETGNSSTFWLRSEGWLIASLCDVLDYFPEGEDKSFLTIMLHEAVDSLLNFQDSTSKLFYQIIDFGPSKLNVAAKYFESSKNTKYQKNGVYSDAEVSNYLEASGSSIIAYTLLKGASSGYLDNHFLDRGKAIFENVYSQFYNPDTHELSNICITAGLGPESNTTRDGSKSYYLAEPVGSNDAKGVGPFILAFIYYLKATK